MNSPIPGAWRSRSDSPHPKLTHPKRTQTVGAYSDKGVIPEAQNSPLSETRYFKMFQGLDKINSCYNILANASTWLLLAGYVSLPGAFTSIRNSHALSDGAGKAGKLVARAFQNTGVLVIATICCATGAAGMIYLSLKHSDNYIWLLNRIIIPGLLNSGAGLVTTLINVYFSRGGFWSVMAIVTATVTGSCTAIMTGLYLLYQFSFLNEVKKDHARIMKALEEQERLGRGGR